MGIFQPRSEQPRSVMASVPEGGVGGKVLEVRKDVSHDLEEGGGEVRAIEELVRILELCRERELPELDRERVGPVAFR